MPELHTIQSEEIYERDEEAGKYCWQCGKELTIERFNHYMQGGGAFCDTTCEGRFMSEQGPTAFDPHTCHD